MQYLILKRAASNPSGRNHCRHLPQASLRAAGASSYLLRLEGRQSSIYQTCVNDAIQEVEQSNKLPTSVQRCVSSHRGLTRILRATSRLRPWMELQQQNDLLGGLDYLDHPTYL